MENQLNRLDSLNFFHLVITVNKKFTTGCFCNCFPKEELLTRGHCGTCPRLEIISPTTLIFLLFPACAKYSEDMLPRQIGLENVITYSINCYWFSKPKDNNRKTCSFSWFPTRNTEISFSGSSDTNHSSLL